MMNSIDATLLMLGCPAIRLTVQERASKFLASKCPCVSTLCPPDVTVHDQISQAFPLHICILAVIKDWRWEWPGNEATFSVGAKPTAPEVNVRSAITG